MRRIVIADALSRGALHFYCGGSSVLIDAYSQEENGNSPLPEEIKLSLSESRGKFKDIKAVLYTEAKTSRWCSDVLGLRAVGADCEPLIDTFSFGYLTAQRYMSKEGKICAWLLRTDGLSVVVCGNAGHEDIITFAAQLPEGVTHAFVSVLALLNGNVTSALQKRGVSHLFLYHMPVMLSDEDTSRLNKRVNKLTKFGFVVRIINSYPSGIII